MERKKIVLYLLLIAVVIAVVFLPGFSELQRLREENDRYKQRISLLRRRNDTLREELSKMREDPLYLEKKAREKLGIVKEGEIIYRVRSTE
jgi:cell division protein FtsB